MQYQGIIFDLDGVLCSTDEYHYRAWKALADRLGIPFDRERNGLLRGVSRMDSLNIILEKSDKAYSQDEKNAMAEEKNTRYRQLLNQMSPADLSGDVKRTLDTLRARGLKLAIGSSSKNTPFILERMGLDGFFDAVADGNCITHSKPNPEVFLKAAEMLGLKPEQCVVWWRMPMQGWKLPKRAGLPALPWGMPRRMRAQRIIWGNCRICWSM